MKLEKRDERLAMFYKNDFFIKHKGLAEEIMAYEEKTALKMPSDFVIPPFIEYEVGENKVVLGRVHKSYLFAMAMPSETKYRLFPNKGALKLFFTQMKGLEKEDMVFWLNEVEVIDYNIQKLLASVIN